MCESKTTLVDKEREGMNANANGVSIVLVEASVSERDC